MKAFFFIVLTFTCFSQYLYADRICEDNRAIHVSDLGNVSNAISCKVTEYHDIFDLNESNHWRNEKIESKMVLWLSGDCLNWKGEHQLAYNQYKVEFSHNINEGSGLGLKYSVSAKVLKRKNNGEGYFVINEVLDESLTNRLNGNKSNPSFRFYNSEHEIRSLAYIGQSTILDKVNMRDQGYSYKDELYPLLEKSRLNGVIKDSVLNGLHISCKPAITEEKK